MIIKLGQAHVKLKTGTYNITGQDTQMLDNLINKLAKAEKGTRELDAEIHCQAYPDRITNPNLTKGYTIVDTEDPQRNNSLVRSPYISSRKGPSPHYTTNVGSALQLLPEITGDNVKHGRDKVDWMLAKTNGGLTIHACAGSMEKSFAETPALALCIAALKARKENEDV